MVQSHLGKDGLSRTDRLVSSSGNDDSLQTIQNEVIETMADELIDDAVLNVIFEVHKDWKLGLLSVEDGQSDDDDESCQVNVEGLEVLGHVPTKKQYECECPSCHRNLAASRFAPHLEKCMGMGRNSSRIASRRIQNSTRENNSILTQGSDFDDDDEDWVEKKRRKRDKNSPRRSRTLKNKATESSLSNNNSNGSASLPSVGNNNGTNSSMETILLSSSMEDKSVLFSQMCGVISGHTGRMCTRSLKCPQHTSEQRKLVRMQMLPEVGDIILGGSHIGGSTSCSSSKFIVENDQTQFDAESLDHEGPIASTWDHELSNTTSPSDSTSTNNSSSNGTSTSSFNTKRSKTSVKNKRKTNKKKELISD